MNYKQARDYIQNLTARGIVPGLESISALCEVLGNPQKELNFVHISGTNGKGSVGAFLQSVLLSGGRTTGRFVSPYVFEYAETFTYNGRNISENDYSECVTKVRAAIEILNKKNIYPTAFEAETAIAFLFFAKYRPDYVLLECGMGGLLDSTNVIDSPVLAVITSVSKDHSAFLGDTLRDIAFQKAGIIKQGTNVVTAMHSEAVSAVIESECRQKNAQLNIVQPTEEIKYLPDTTEFIFENEKYSISLLGAYQPYNAALAIKSAKLLGLGYNEIYTGLKNTIWGYRFERFGKYILDGAHNEDAAGKLAQSMSIYLKNGTTAFICGCFRDKDYKAIVKHTACYCDCAFCITPPSERGLGSDILASEFIGNGVKAVSFGSDLAEAVRASKEFDNIVVFGSLSILSEAKKCIEREK